MEMLNFFKIVGEMDGGGITTSTCGMCLMCKPQITKLERGFAKLQNSDEGDAGDVFSLFYYPH